jgi:Protocatechuate 3,4-dioxygenase beta subunit N terminal/Dioxygenase
MQSERDPLPFRPYESGTQPPYDAPSYGSTQKRHPQERPVSLPHTITETTGPRFSTVHFPAIPDLSIVDGKTALGERIIVRGRITDEDGRPAPRTIVEIWQANSMTPRSIQISAARAGSTPTTRAGTGSPRSSRAPILGATTTMRGARTISISRSSGRGLPPG